MDSFIFQDLIKNVVVATFLLVGASNESSAIKYDEDGFEIVSNEPDPGVLATINDFYKKDVRPIFKNKCLDCHGSLANKPWYYELPGARQLIQRDIREAKSHMDMSNGFPFKGHGSPKDDLESIERTINENSMPPWQYLLMHWDSRPSEEEKQIILNWINQSQKLLKGEKP